MGFWGTVLRVVFIDENEAALDRCLPLTSLFRLSWFRVFLCCIFLTCPGKTTKCSWNATANAYDMPMILSVDGQLYRIAPIISNPLSDHYHYR